MRYHKENFQYLKNELQLSARNCHQTKAGYVRNRPITAPDLVMYDAIDVSMRVSTLDPRPATVFDTIGHLIRPLTPQRTIVSRAGMKYTTERCLLYEIRIEPHILYLCPKMQCPLEPMIKKLCSSVVLTK